MNKKLLLFLIVLGIVLYSTEGGSRRRKEPTKSNQVHHSAKTSDHSRHRKIRDTDLVVDHELSETPVTNNEHRNGKGNAKGDGKAQRSEALSETHGKNGRGREQEHGHGDQSMSEAQTDGKGRRGEHHRKGHENQHQHGENKHGHAEDNENDSSESLTPDIYTNNQTNLTSRAHLHPIVQHTPVKGN